MNTLLNVVLIIGLSVMITAGFVVWSHIRTPLSFWLCTVVLGCCLVYNLCRPLKL